uniref:Protein UL38 n=1 Tax=Cardioderma bat herpesvirus TaxID=3141914 RepID=A0AAU7E0Y1_9VIRU
MISQTIVKHNAGVKIFICDSTYKLLTFIPGGKEWLKTMYAPMDGELIVFGVSEAWKPFSQTPARQIVYLISGKYDVFAHTGGIFFYLAPDMKAFWNSPIYFEYDNAIFPHAMACYVQQKSSSLEDYVLSYHVFDLQRAIMNSNRPKGEEMHTGPKHKNRVYRILKEVDQAVLQEKLPPVFIDRDMITKHCNRSFFSSFLSKWIEYYNSLNEDIVLSYGVVKNFTFMDHMSFSSLKICNWGTASSGGIRGQRGSTTGEIPPFPSIEDDEDANMPLVLRRNFLANDGFGTTQPSPFPVPWKTCHVTPQSSCSVAERVGQGGVLSATASEGGRPAMPSGGGSGGGQFLNTYGFSNPPVLLESVPVSRLLGNKPGNDPRYAPRETATITETRGTK